MGDGREVSGVRCRSKGAGVKRWVFNIAVLTSVLLLVAVGVLWVRSCYHRYSHTIWSLARRDRMVEGDWAICSPQSC